MAIVSKEEYARTRIELYLKEDKYQCFGGPDNFYYWDPVLKSYVLVYYGDYYLVDMIDIEATIAHEGWDRDDTLEKLISNDFVLLTSIFIGHPSHVDTNQGKLYFFRSNK